MRVRCCPFPSISVLCGISGNRTGRTVNSLTHRGDCPVLEGNLLGSSYVDEQEVRRILKPCGKLVHIDILV